MPVLRRCPVATAIRLARLIVAVALLNAACGGGPSLTAPTPTLTAPTPTLWSGTWRGTFFDQDGPGTMTWEISPSTGSSLNGTVAVIQNGQSASGPLSGSTSGSDATFLFTLTACPGGCASSGTANVTNTTLKGTYTSTNLTGQPRTGLFTLIR